MKYSLPIIFVLLIFTACQQDEMTRPSVSGDILFAVSEQYPNQEASFPELSLSIATKEIFNCMNYELSINQKLEDGILTVEFMEIIKPGI
ncbi:MAG: hypothetical protein ACI8QD_002401 [Cyclobacteriaceae bacterium]|jgi:hypothetical protein